jgi:hypothetical protein
VHAPLSLREIAELRDVCARLLPPDACAALDRLLADVVALEAAARGDHERALVRLEQMRDLLDRALPSVPGELALEIEDVLVRRW